MGDDQRSFDLLRDISPSTFLLWMYHGQGLRHFHEGTVARHFTGPRDGAARDSMRRAADGIAEAVQAPAAQLAELERVGLDRRIVDAVTARRQLSAEDIAAFCQAWQCALERRTRPAGPMEAAAPAAPADRRDKDLACARLPLTDLGNAIRFVLRHGERFQWTAERGWLAWDGRRWTRATADGRMARAVHSTVLAIADEAAAVMTAGIDSVMDPERGLTWSAMLRAWALTSQGNTHVSCIARLAQPYLQRAGGDFRLSRRGCMRRQ